jgi:hypothetical protein
VVTQRQCSPAELQRAVGRGWRDGFDGPFHLPAGCDFRWMEPAEACDVLQAAGSLTLRGDSLMRHLSQALLTVLHGDYARTTDALTRAADPGYQPCRCDVAYNDGHADAQGRRADFMAPVNKYCRDHSVEGLTRWDDLAAVRQHLPGLCPKWREMHLCKALEPGADSPCFRAAAARPRGYLLSLGGLHHRALDATTMSVLFSPVGAAPRGTPQGNISLICGLLHAPGANKPAQFLGTHGEAATRAFNAMVLQHACRRPGDFHFDAFAVTYNTTSIDGQHYAQRQNVLLAQVLLNQLRAAVMQDNGGLTAHRRD